MDALTNLMQAVEAFSMERFEELNHDVRASLAEAIELGALIEVRVTPRAKTRVRLLLITPDGAQELTLVSLVDRNHH